jgi:hypothetical protein
MYVPRPDYYKPNGRDGPAPPRASNVKVSEALNKMLADTANRRPPFLSAKQIALEMVTNL